MFHKFSAKPPKASKPPKGSGFSGFGSNNNNNNNGDAGSNFGPGHTAIPPTKRQKVTKACDRCRLWRVKCDEQKPCAQCVGSEVECIVSYAPTRSSQAKESTSDQAIRDSSLIFPPSLINTSQEVPLDTRTPQNNIHREYLDHASHVLGFFNSGQSALAHGSATRSCLFPQLPHPSIPPEQPDIASNALSKCQRSYYIRLFWDSCHPSLQIMSEAEIAELEALPQSNMSDEYSIRSALVDSMIALGIQHSHATGLSGRVLGLQQPSSQQKSHSNSSSRTTWPGFEYFHRSRESMRDSTDVTLDALRCHALMVLYFMKGNAFRDAYNLIGITVRKAYTAKLHRPPPSNLPEIEKTARMQLWWMLFSLDIQCSLQLDMPATIQKSLVKCPFPPEDALTRYVASPSHHEGNTNAYIYPTYLAKLALIVSDIGECVSTADLVDDDNSPAALEYHAIKLSCFLKDIGFWREQLPPGLLPRQYGNSPDNTEMLDFDRVMALPTSLQRQTILLELQYHNVYTLIQRPLIRLCKLHPNAIFKKDTRPVPPEPYVDIQVSSAIHHSTMIIETIFTVCSISDVLYGWSEVLQPLWNATLTVMAYVHAKSLCYVEPRVLDSITHAQEVFKSLSPTCPTAFCARGIINSLAHSLHHMVSIGSSLRSDDDQTGRNCFVSPSEEQHTSPVGLEGAFSHTSIPDVNWMAMHFDES